MILKPVTAESEAAVEILKQAGIVPVSSESGNNLKDILTSSGLDLETVIGEIATLARDCTDPTIKSRNLETALKLHKVLDTDDKKDSGNITINILPLAQARTDSVPAILLPRETPVLQEA